MAGLRENGRQEDCANSLLPDLLMPYVTNKPRYPKMYPGFVQATIIPIPNLNRSPSSLVGGRA
nr:MAG TPA: hypothetical protein [Caudoviricetes sp.]